MPKFFIFYLFIYLFIYSVQKLCWIGCVNYPLILAKKLEKVARPWRWALVIWNLFAFFIQVIIQENRRHSEKCTKHKCVCFNDVIWLMTIKVMLKIKNKSQRYDINWPGPGHKCIEYKMCLNIMMVIYIK